MEKMVFEKEEEKRIYDLALLATMQEGCDLKDEDAFVKRMSENIDQVCRIIQKVYMERNHSFSARWHRKDDPEIRF